MNDGFKQFIKTLCQQNPQLPNDYIKDNILFCGDCNTPKRQFQTFDNETIQVPILCKCQYEKTERGKIEERKRKEQITIDKLRQKGISDNLFTTYTFANNNKTDEDSQHIFAVCNKYVSNFQKMQEKGWGIIFYGNVGTGKTFYAVSIANALIDNCIPVLVTNFPTILNEIQQTFEKDNYINSLLTYDLLVIDDFGVERNTEYALEQMYNVIDAMYRNKKPVIITTNMDIADFRNAKTTMQERIFERLTSMCIITLKVVGKSKRQEQAIEDKKLAKEILSE